MLMQFSESFTLSARGGAPSYAESLWKAGGGGGGRIAIHADQISKGDMDDDMFAEKVNVRGGAVSR